MKLNKILIGMGVVLVLVLGVLVFDVCLKKTQNFVKSGAFPPLNQTLAEVKQRNAQKPEDPNLLPPLDADYQVVFKPGRIINQSLTIHAGEMVTFRNVYLPKCTMISKGNQEVTLKLALQMERPLHYNLRK
jgi:hypothetical protein